MERELVVTDDMPREAVRLFREARPRTLVLAGGETPRPIYRQLARERYRWDEVDVFFGDERCVPPEHLDSNYRMANETLLSFVPARVHRMPGESCAAESYEWELREFFDGLPRFDVVFLGLGADGHTASLFPGDPAQDETERWVVRVQRPDHERLTLTPPVLSAARLAVFLIAGAEKRDALQRMMAGEDIPANRITAERVVVLADAAAASEVDKR